MNAKKVDTILKEIENIHLENDIANYGPMFDFTSFRVEDNLEESLKKFLRDFSKDDDVTFTISKAKFSVVNEYAKNWLLKSAEEPSVELKPKERLHTLVNQVIQELNELSEAEIFNIRSIHTEFFDCASVELLFVLKDKAYYLYLGFYD
jgi:hypothetical protein